MFRGRVGHMIGPRRSRCDRAVIDDAAAPGILIFHHAECRLRAQEDARQVDIDNRTPLLERQILNRNPRRVQAGIVEQDVEPSELPLHLREQRVYRIRLAHVRPNRRAFCRVRRPPLRRSSRVRRRGVRRAPPSTPRHATPMPTPVRCRFRRPSPARFVRSLPSCLYPLDWSGGLQPANARTRAHTLTRRIMSKAFQVGGGGGMRLLLRIGPVLLAGLLAYLFAQSDPAEKIRPGGPRNQMRRLPRRRAHVRSRPARPRHHPEGRQARPRHRPRQSRREPALQSGAAAKANCKCRPARRALTAAEVNAIRDWINGGAKWDIARARTTAGAHLVVLQEAGAARRSRGEGRLPRAQSRSTLSSSRNSRRRACIPRPRPIARTLRPPRLFRSARLAAHSGAGGPNSSTTSPPTPTRSSSTACSPRRDMASAGAATGWTWFATPIRRALRPITSSPPRGAIAIG